MKTIVIVGAGPNLGLALAKKFGQHGFKIALLARQLHHLQALQAQLTSLNMTSQVYPVDVRDQAALKRVLQQIQHDFGHIDVVAFNPYAGPQDFRNVATMTPADVQQQLALAVWPALTIANTVLPEMQQRQSGALLFTSGISARHAIPQLGNTGIAAAGLRNYAENLHHILQPQHIYVGFLAVASEIKVGGPGDPARIADQWYQRYCQQKSFETIFPPLA